MAYYITDDCINCGACEPECDKNMAITEGNPVYRIDHDRCTECVGNYASPRCADVCPVDAPRPDPNHREMRDQLLQKWYRLHPGETPAVT